jgi:DNA-binding MarR family transcriptional regulator
MIEKENHRYPREKFQGFSIRRMFTMMTDSELAEETKDMKLTKSQMIVLGILRKTGRDGVTPKQLLDNVSFAPRTVRYALRKLLKKNLIKRVPCLQDMRQWIYVPA